MELDNGDFGRTMARQLVVAAYQLPLWQALCSSTDATLPAVAGKAVKEVAYHLDHASSWVIRLGDGTEESHLRMQQGLDEVWPYAAELFEIDALLTPLVEQGIAADPAPLQAAVGAHDGAGADRGDAGRPGDRLATHGRPDGAAHRAVRLPAGRAAAPAPLASRSDAGDQRSGGARRCSAPSPTQRSRS